MPVHPNDEDVKMINRQLLEKFGKIDGHARYRVVLSYDQLEKRFGTFVQHDPIYYTWTGVKEGPKYVWRDRYILEAYQKEQLAPGEIKNWNNYEGFYVFHDASFEPLAINYRICEFFCFVHQKGEFAGPSEQKAQVEKFDNDEVKFNKMVLDDAASPFDGRLALGE